MFHYFTRLAGILVLGTALGAPPAASAQDARSAGAPPPFRVEVSTTVAGANPEVTVFDCCWLRELPRFPATGTTFTALTVGASIRVYWAPSLSAVVDAGCNRPARKEFTFATPATAPPALPGFVPTATMGRATERRGWTMSIGQELDLPARGRWRPWLGGELILERIAEDYTQTTLVYAVPTRVSVSEEARTETFFAGALGAGVRVDVGRRVFLAADGSYRWYFPPGVRELYTGREYLPLTRAAKRWRLGVGIRLGPAGKVPTASALTAVQPQDAREMFFAALKGLCGARFEGVQTFSTDGASPFAGKVLVAHVASCSEDEIRVPFLVGEDRSRTWVFSRTAGGLQLKHDHRHADGTPDAITMYGGMATATGTGLVQSFAADAHTAELIPAAVTNVWTVSLSADGASLTYHLERDARPRFTAVLKRVYP